VHPVSAIYIGYITCVILLIDVNNYFLEFTLTVVDILSEAVAATSSGMNSSLLMRPGNAPLADIDRNSFHVLSTFDELFV